MKILHNYLQESFSKNKDYKGEITDDYVKSNMIIINKIAQDISTIFKSLKPKYYKHAKGRQDSYYYETSDERSYSYNPGNHKFISFNVFTFDWVKSINKLYARDGDDAINKEFNKILNIILGKLKKKYKMESDKKAYASPYLIKDDNIILSIDLDGDKNEDCTFGIRLYGINKLKDDIDIRRLGFKAPR